MICPCHRICKSQGFELGLTCRPNAEQILDRIRLVLVEEERIPSGQNSSC